MRGARLVLLGLAAGCVREPKPDAQTITLDVHPVGSAAPLQLLPEPPAPVATGPVYVAPPDYGPPSEDTPVFGDAPVSTFSRIACWHALHEVSLARCNVRGGPQGDGLIILTFENSGHVLRSAWGAGPFANTPTGSCIQLSYQSAHVPAFIGPNVNIGKSFTLP